MVISICFDNKQLTTESEAECVLVSRESSLGVDWQESRIVFQRYASEKNVSVLILMIRLHTAKCKKCQDLQAWSPTSDYRAAPAFASSTQRNLDGYEDFLVSPGWNSLPI